MKCVAYGETHPGYVRSNNEDAFLWLPEANLAVVADGMAGHRFGELASAIATNTIRRFYSSDELDHLLIGQFARAKRAGLEPRPLPYDQFKLRRAMEEANLAIFNTARRNPQYDTMGTTIVGLSFGDKSAYVAHVGDSRIYRFRKGTLEQITKDHSLFNEYVRMNLVRSEDADSFPLKNVVVRAMGLQEAVAADTAMKSVRDGDEFLLCSDGLSDYVPAAQIESAMAQDGDPEAQVKRLLALALQAGGPDNVTALVVRLEDE
ncbi:MAG: serine/threonine-protein phosphatase [Deltaproteobacteria bacterium]|nr:serine/threonine-protein phosphatase [Deltaproteobacteria bacterium]